MNVSPSLNVKEGGAGDGSVVKVQVHLLGSQLTTYLGSRLTTKGALMDMLNRTSVSSNDLEQLMKAVERADNLDLEFKQSYLLDPCCMLDALSDVYTASRRLVQASRHGSQDMTAGTAS